MNQHVRPLGLKPRPSDPAALEYQWEPFAAVAQELPPLFRRNYNEVGQSGLELEPDWSRYAQYDLAGHLRILTCREHGSLTGYVFVLIHTGLNYASTPWASIEKVWVDPVYRDGRGLELVRKADRELVEIGAKVIDWAVALKFERSGVLQKFLERLGYRPREIIYSKITG